jgi:hypothetical protein
MPELNEIEQLLSEWVLQVVTEPATKTTVENND